jgi:hypothetical protein
MPFPTDRRVLTTGGRVERARAPVPPLHMVQKVDSVLLAAARAADDVSLCSGPY